MRYRAAAARFRRRSQDGADTVASILQQPRNHGMATGQ